jgi:hypothetical protein
MPKELRVHGVSGTPPAELLYTAPVTYDDSPELAKVFEPNRDTWDVKAYHWGSLTSKSSLTAFWILLAPFAMANVAGWMSEAPNIWSRIWVRVAGLSLTGILFAQAANMTFDIPRSTGMSATSTVWLFYGASIVLVLGLGLLSTQTTFGTMGLGQRLRYLFAPSIDSMNPLYQTADWTDPAAGAELSGEALWGKHSILHRLRRLHLTFAVAVLAVVAARAVEAAAIEATAAIVGGIALALLAFTAGRAATNHVALRLTAVAPLAAIVVLIWSFFSLAAGELIDPPVNISDDLTFEMALILGLSAGLGLAGEMLRGGLTRGWVPLGLLAVAALVGGTFGLTGAMLVETYLNEASDVGWAKILMVAVPSVLIIRSIVGGLLNGQDSRRQVGILWDLGSFWPRWFHPLGPPAYGPNAVQRLRTLIDEEEPEVLAAHSQGSLVSAVAIALSEDDTAPGLFVTYGSQLGFLYPSLFPSVGFDRLISTVSDQVEGRWINLWRPTDVVGGQVIDALGTRNWRVVSRGGHSGYELTPEFCAARNASLSGELAMPPLEYIKPCWDQIPPTNVQ